eukprot:jgi/Botrbrau1/15164/Bobra.0149s0029.1
MRKRNSEVSNMVFLSNLRLCTSIAALLACGLYASVAEGMYDKSDYVLELTGKNFASLVDDSNLISVVEFYAPWCGHCKALAPAFKKVAEKLEGVVTVGAVDCDNDKNKPLCGRFQVQGFPTIKIFPASKKKNPYTKKLEKIAEDYTGPRTAKGIVAAALAALPSTGVTRVRFLSGAGRPEGLHTRGPLFFC